jgi:phosphinothricin acetyltransferase
MELRDATEADLPAIVAIYNATIPSRMVTADTEPVSVESRFGWFGAHLPARHPLWVIDSDGVVVAWFSFQPFYGRPAYHATAEISLYVAESYRRRGIGRLLVQEAIRRAPALGLKTLLAFVFGHNQPSLHLLEGEGFERWAFMPGICEMDGVEYDVLILGRKV